MKLLPECNECLLGVFCWQEKDVRLRKVAISQTTSSTPTPSSQPTVVEQTNAVPPIVYLIAAIILGLILGKFIL